jgi:hypothetical protein
MLNRWGQMGKRELIIYNSDLPWDFTAFPHLVRSGAVAAGKRA